MKQFDIKELIPFMKNGWVAMDKNENWCWFGHKPVIHFGDINKWLRADINDNWCYIESFNITPVSDWTKSLIKIENKDE